jgi:putative ABC transport system substrate-binding protein
MQHTPGPSGDDAIRGLASRSDILVVWSALRTVAVKRLAPDVPTIFLSVGDPVAIGLVQSLSHPGGNMTGVTFEAGMDAYGKRLQLLKEMVPDPQRVGVLRAANHPNVEPAMSSLVPAAERLGLVLQPVDFRSEAELEGAFQSIERAGSQGILVLAGAQTSLAGRRIAELVLTHRLPSSGPFKETVQDGGLVGYGPDFTEMARQGASYLDRIMRGAQPSDLPVELPKRYEMYVNLNTARALGLEVPTSLLATADVVVE